MTAAQFIAKWRHVDLKERSAAQEHFLDLCAVFDHPTPAAADPTGAMRVRLFVRGAEAAETRAALASVSVQIGPATIRARFDKSLF